MIFVTDMPADFGARKHYVAPYLFHLAVTKRCRLFAKKGRNQNGRAVEWKERGLSVPDDQIAGEDEYEIGIYNETYGGIDDVYSISWKHDCITKYMAELRKANPKKPFILNIPARLAAKDLNTMKPNRRKRTTESSTAAP